MDGQTVSPSKPSGLVITFLGCGTLGTAILTGLLSYLYDAQHVQSGTARTHSINRFIACVRGTASASRIKLILPRYPQSSVTVLEGENLKGVIEADVVILGCKPHAFRDLLSEDGIRDALAKKTLISILGGVSVDDIKVFLYGPGSPNQRKGDTRCSVVKALPNIAASVRESITLITEEPTLDSMTAKLVTFIFSCVGQLKWISSNGEGAANVLSGSGPAYFALMLEAAAQSAIKNGTTKSDAYEIAALAMIGAAKLILAGEEPAAVVRKVAVPGGSTMQGLKVLEVRGVKEAITDALEETNVALGKLIKGEHE